MHTWTLSAYLLTLFTDAALGGYCSFPTLLWQRNPHQTSRKWLGHTEFFRNTDFWERQTEITAKESEILLRKKVNAPCDRDVLAETGTVPCYREDIVFNYRCIAEERNGKYRIQQNIKGKSNFSCLRFERRGNDVIQIYRAEPQEQNVDRLCNDDALQRDDWIWIAEEQTEWTLCSLHGGFDFEAYARPLRERLCKNEWRPSRLESECVRGEGLQFFFPDRACSPFHVQRERENFRCRGGWEEEQFSFLLFSVDAELPRYVLRLPRNANIYDEQSATLFFSPTTPLSKHSARHAHGHHIELQMLRSEPGVCYDESKECQRLAEQGRCTNTGLHRYANYCKRSCGLCQLATSPNAECSFPSALLQDWVGFSSPNQRVQVSVQPGMLHFSTLPTLICKSRHWQQHLYKTYSTFTNGCRPRYICVELKQGDGLTVEFRLSRSDLNDLSFDLCHFYDDPLPLGDSIRSSKPKIWLPMSSMYHGSCGVGGLARVIVTLSDDRQCNGIVRDVRLNTCEAESYLSLDLPSCTAMQAPVFICTAFTRLNSGSSFLVTKMQGQDGDYICWLIDESTHLSFSRVRCDTKVPIQITSHRDIVQMSTMTVIRDLEEEPCGIIAAPVHDNVLGPYQTNTLSPIYKHFRSHSTSMGPLHKGSQNTESHNDPNSNLNGANVHKAVVVHELTSSSVTLQSYLWLMLTVGFII